MYICSATREYERQLADVTFIMNLWDKRVDKLCDLIDSGTPLVDLNDNLYFSIICHLYSRCPLQGKKSNEFGLKCEALIDCYICCRDNLCRENEKYIKFVKEETNGKS